MNRWRTLVILVAAGVPALLWLFPRYDLTARAFHLVVSRGQASRLLRQEAARHGVDTTGWEFAVESSRVNSTIDVRIVFPDAPALQAFTGAHVRAMATNGRGGKVEGSFFADGRPEFFESAQSLATLSPRTELDHFAGSASTHFVPVTQGAVRRDGTLYTWEWTDPTQPGIVARFESLQRDGKAIRSGYSLHVGAQTAELARTRSHGVDFDLVTVLATIFMFVGIGLAFWVYFRSMTQRTDHLRFPLAFTAILLFFNALPVITKARTDEVLLNPAESALSGVLAGVILTSLFKVLVHYVLLGAGYASLPETERFSWTGLQLISRWRFAGRRVGTEILAGMLAGIPLLGILYVGAAVFDRMARLYEIAYLTARWPLLSSLDSLNQFEVLFTFGLLIPLCLRYLRRAWLPWAAIAAAGIILITQFRRPYESAAWIDLTGGTALFIGLFLLYRHFGLLAALVAGISTATVHHALSFGFQPDPDLTGAGWKMAGLYGLLVLGSGLLAFRGRTYDEAEIQHEMTPRGSDVSRSKSDRLQADFAVARRVQQNLLPSSPPAVPGLDIAAACRPAREVGGDLYDFPRLADGRTTFCVADVSGKGVPAALYMTLTTGILAAAARRSLDVREIVNQLNRHLHAACRRRTFVTLSLGVWDESSRRFEHVRAGHNPLLHRSASGRASYIQPLGLGLGLVRPATFERAIETHSLVLAPGDVVILYSDGLVEAMNPAREQFGEDRLKEVVESCKSSDAASIQSRILQAVDEFTAGAEPHDDLTVMVLAAAGAS